MIKMVTDKKSGLEKPDFFNSKTILNLLYFSILRRVSCFRPYKYTNFKAIHNSVLSNKDVAELFSTLQIYKF